MILQKILKQWRHHHKIFSLKNLVQVNSDRMALSILKKHVCEKSTHHTAEARGEAFLHT